jgi:hypothetical protein
MDAQAAAAAAARINASIHFADGGSWDTVAWGADPGWVDELMGRVVGLVGRADIEYVDGYVESASSEAGPRGEIIVFTERSIVRAPFSTTHDGYRQLALQATVTAMPRSAVRSVELSVASPVTDSGVESWPGRAAGTVHFDDGTSVALPLGGPRRRVQSGAVAHLLAGLFGN